MTDTTDGSGGARTLHQVARAAGRSGAESLVGQSIADPDDERSPGLPLAELPRELSDLTVDVVEDIEILDVQVVDEYDGGDGQCKVTVDCSMSLEGFILKADFAVLDDPRVTVLDPDVNDHTMSAQINVKVRIEFDVLVVGQDFEEPSLASIELV